jgi:hypothetical protein
VEVTALADRVDPVLRLLIASPEERKRLWPKAVVTYGGYGNYQKRTDREIPLVILEPRRPTTSS